MSNMAELKRNCYFCNNKNPTNKDMKKFCIFFATTLVVSSFTGCSNDTNDLIPEKDIILPTEKVFTAEELSSMRIEKFPTWQSANDSLNAGTSYSQHLSRARTIIAKSAPILTLYGCTSQSNGKNYKYILPSQIANSLHIAKDIYVVRDVTCYNYIKVDGENDVFLAQKSPNCGLRPTNTTGDYTRGYTSSTPDQDGKTQMTTKLLYIICDISGRSYNMWYPCSPEKLEWNYKILRDE